MTTTRVRRLATAFVLAISADTRSASACATCGCGDPTLTAMGSEQPFRDRLRASLDARYRTDAVGEPGVDRIDVRDLRFDGQVAWAPHERLFVFAAIPVVHRRVRYVNDAAKETTSLGDVELRAKVFALVDREVSTRHLFALTGGLKMPTAPRQRDERDGSLLPPEAQPGTGSWDLLLGASYAVFPRPFSFYASIQGMAPLRSTSALRTNASLRTTTALQYQLLGWLAPRIGVDTRLDGRAYEDGRPERDSSGFIAFLSPELLFAPLTDVVVVLSLRVPVLQRLAGYHEEGPIVGAAVAYDF